MGVCVSCYKRKGQECGEKQVWEISAVRIYPVFFHRVKNKSKLEAVSNSQLSLTVQKRDVLLCVMLGKEIIAFGVNYRMRELWTTYDFGVTD